MGWGGGQRGERMQVRSGFGGGGCGKGERGGLGGLWTGTAGVVTDDREQIYVQSGYSPYGGFVKDDREQIYVLYGGGGDRRRNSAV